MTECKNIWILNHYAITPDLPGGTRHYDFAKELTKRGYNVLIFASSFIHGIFENKKLARGERWKIENHEGVKFVWVKTLPYKGNGVRRVLNMLSYSISVERISKKLFKESEYPIEKPDLIIGSSVHPFAALSGYRLSKYFKVPFIFEVRDLWPQTLIDLGEISPYHPFVVLLGWIEKFLYKKASKIITLLPKAEDYIVSKGIEKDKIIWIPNGVNLDKFAIDKNDTGKKSGFKVLYAGAHGVANGLDTLLESAKILKQMNYRDIIFELVGDGPEKDKLIVKAREKQLDNVFFKGPVKKDEIPKILNSADILYFSLLGREVFKYGISSNKLFDYLASGKPIIFSSNSSNNPVAEAGAGLTVPPENPEAVAEAIIKLYKMDKKEREIMGERGKKYVEKYYSIYVLVDKLEQVIREVVDEKAFDSQRNI